MPRSNTGSTGGSWLSTSSAPVTAPPFSASGWAYIVDGTVNSRLFSVSNAASDRNFWSVMWSSAGQLQLGARDTAGGVTTNTIIAAAGIGAARLFHWGCVIISDVDRWIYLNGVGTQGTTARLPTGIDTVSLGVLHFNGTTDNPLFGRIGATTIWTTDLSADDMYALSRGVYGKRIRPESIITHYDLALPARVERDNWRGFYNLNMNGTMLQVPFPATPYHEATGTPNPKWDV